MSRKDFELIAQVLKEQKVALECVKAMAHALATTNTRFDYWRFVHAAYHGKLDVQKGA